LERIRIGCAVRLECDKCVVRDWARSDKDALLRFANNRNVWRNLTDMFPHPYTETDAERMGRLLTRSSMPLWTERPADPSRQGTHHVNDTVIHIILRDCALWGSPEGTFAPWLISNISPPRSPVCACLSPVCGQTETFGIIPLNLRFPRSPGGCSPRCSGPP